MRNSYAFNKTVLENNLSLWIAVAERLFPAPGDSSNVEGQFSINTLLIILVFLNLALAS